MTGGFEERIALANAQERAVASDLRARGLQIEPFGQALLAPAVRDVLKLTDSLLRWLPDLIGWRPGKPKLFLVDAKGCKSSNTPNHSIEIRSLLAARLTMLPVFYVCEEYRALPLAVPFEDGIDGSCCDQCWRRVLDDPLGQELPVRCPEHQRRAGRGSGTPYVLIRNDRCRALEQLFGSIVSGEVA